HRSRRQSLRDQRRAFGDADRDALAACAVLPDLGLFAAFEKRESEDGEVCTETRVTMSSAMAPVAAEIIPGRSPTKRGCHRDAERSVKANLRIDASDDRECDRLGNQGERDDESGD